ncbi:MAG: fibronectin type III domain-containing protein, partial [Thermoguttaceae bacterium]|nr:fibronectin type III domain-containing protein [Thermoguttaceae bacterium]
MTKNHKSSLFSNRSSRRSEKRAPRGTSLRFEALENRELLSVNAADYAQLRESFDQLALPENFSDVNVIELPALTAEALQNAINDAATTPQDDLIVVNPAELGENTLSLADATIVVDFDASEFGAVSLVSTGDERLQISVNPEDYSFDFRSGVLNFAGLDFVDVADATLMVSADVEPLMSGLVDSAVGDVQYYDADGRLINEEALLAAFGDPESSTEEAADPEERLEIQEGSLSYYSPNDYAILFVGLVKNSSEDVTFSSEVSSLYNVMVNTHHLNPDNIIILYSGGYSVTGGLPAGRPVQKATFANLKAAFAKMDKVMNSDSRLFVYMGDHGGGYATNAYSGVTTEETVAAYADNYWGYTTFDAYEFRDALYQIRSGYVTLAFGTCFGGGMLDEIVDPATGAVKNYTGQAHFAGGAAANHYQYGWFYGNRPCDWTEYWSVQTTVVTRFLGIKIREKTYTEYFSERHLTYTGALVEGLKHNTYVNNVFDVAERSYEFSARRNTWQFYPNDGGDYPVDGVSISHSWHAGENFAIFNSAVSKTYSTPSPYVKSVGDSSITVKWNPVSQNDVGYRVQWREREGGKWSQRYVTAQEYARNGNSFTINNLAGGKTYDVCVSVDYRPATKIFFLTIFKTVSSFNSLNIQATTNKKIADPTFTTVSSANSVKVTITNWDADASSYTLTCRDLTTNVNKTFTVNSREYTISGLSDGTQYSISVKANGGKQSKNTSGYNYWSVDSKWTTKTLYTPKKLVASPLKMGADSTDIIATVAQTGNVTCGGEIATSAQMTGYEIQYREVGATKWVPEIPEKTSTFVSPKLPSGRYEVRYRAVGLDRGDGKIMDTESSEWVTANIVSARRFVVTTLADDPNNAGSLRYAINQLADSSIAVSDQKELIIFRLDPAEYASANHTIRLGSTMTINRSVTIDASNYMNADGTPGLIIDANGKQAFNFGANATNVSINGLAIKNASATGSGGAIRSEAQNLMVTNSAFEDNHANNGSAIYVNQGVNVTIKNSVFSGNDSTHSSSVIIRSVKNGAITISDSKFIGNTSNSATYTDNDSVAHGGAAIFINKLNQQAPVTISGCEFIGNESINARGGAVFFEDGNTATISDCIFEGNSALWSGGAIEAWSSNVTIDGSLFTGNSSTDSGQGYGGAYSARQSTTKITHSEFVDNYANQQGGALFIESGSSAIDVASFHGNSARQGAGAIKMTRSRNTLYNALLYGNSVVVDAGGAIHLSSTGATSDTETSLSVNNTTIVDNSAPNASAIGVFTQTSGKAATLNVENSIVLPSADGAAIGVVGTAASITATNVLSTAASEWTSRTNFWTYDPSKPLFTDEENGDYTLAPGSQAFNRGTDLYANGVAATVDATRDLSGAPRQVGGRVDLGAFESQTYETRTWTVTSSLDSLEEGTLRYALVNAHEGDVVLFDASMQGETIELTIGELPIMEGITIDALSVYDAERDKPGVTISGGGSSRVFNVWKDARDVAIRGLTIANGCADRGGGIYKGVNSNLTLEDCVFEYNIAETGNGGGVYATGGELNVVGSTFRANRTLSTGSGDHGNGVGLCVNQCATTVVSSTFFGNKASRTGAIYAKQSQLDVESSTFAQNTSSYQISAILFTFGSSGSIRNSLFYENTSPTGCVVRLSASNATSDVEVTIENSTIVNNSTSGASDASPAISMYTSDSNYSGTYNINNSIVAFNGGSGQYGSYSTPKGAQTFNVRNTLVTQSVDTTKGNINYTGTIDALFTDAANDDYTLLPDSVAINAGSNDYVTSEKDLAGEWRIQAGRVDLGAFECASGRTIVVSSATDDANDPGSLRYAVENARHGDYILFADALQG